MSSQTNRQNKDILSKGSADRKQYSPKLVHKNLFTSSSGSLSNSLDWDSPSHKTGTVKRRPLSSSDCSVEDEPNQSRVIQLRNRFSHGDASTKVKTYDKDKEKFAASTRKLHQQTFIPKIIVPRNGCKEKEVSSEWSQSAATHKDRVIPVTLTPSPYAVPTTISSGSQPQTKTRVIFDVTSSATVRDRLGARHRTFIASDKSGEAILKTNDDNTTVADEDSSYTGHTGAKCISDTDSGIASPLSPSSLGSNGGGFGSGPDTYTSFGYIQGFADDNTRGTVAECRRDGCDCEREQIQIYTDWANHYLEKGRSKKRVNSLAADCSDGVLLADVIESVTCQKIPDITRKPKTPAQMLDNINLCLNTLKVQHVAGVDAVSAQDLRDGRLKAILALFFALSRHKQAVKQRNQAAAAAAHQQQADMTPNRSTSLASQQQHKTNPTSSIPLPGSALPSRRCPPGMDKVRPITTASSSRAPSPAVSMIPQRGAAAAAPTPSPIAQQPMLVNGGHVVGSPYHQQMGAPGAGHQKGSMLDKLRLFKGGDGGVTRQQTSCGKRTSSSSGVSSARSERSDSSVSLDVISPENSKVRSTSRLKPHKVSTSTSTGNVKCIASANGGVNIRNSPNASKKESSKNINSNMGKIIIEIERHGQKVAQIQNPSSNNKPANMSQNKLSKPHHQQELPMSRHNSQQILCTSASSTALSSSNITVTSGGNNNPSTGIPKPTAAIKGTSVIVKVEKNKGGISRENTQMALNAPKPTIGVVSPMKSDSQSQLSESSYSISTGPQSNSSDSSVIYKASSDSGTELHIKSNDGDRIAKAHQHITDVSEKELINDESRKNIGDKLINTMGQMSNGLVHTEKSQGTYASNQLLQSPPTSTIPSSTSLTPFPTTSSATSISSSQSTTTININHNAASNIPPMRPLFRPHYSTSATGTSCINSNLTLPTPRARPMHPPIAAAPGGHVYSHRVQPDGGSDYCDLMLGGGGNSGYMSDGEILRYPGSVGRAQQMQMLQYGAVMQSGCPGGYGGMIGGMDNTGMYSDGYMSEGGIGLYTRRQQQQQQQGQILMGVNGTDRNPTTSISSQSSSTNVLTDQQTRTRGRQLSLQQQQQDDILTNQSPVPPPPGPRKNISSSYQSPTFPSVDKHSTSSQWKRYTDSPGVGSPPIQPTSSGPGAGQSHPPPPPAPGSPTGVAGSRERRSSPHGGSNNGVKEGKGGKVRGVPQSFGYVKRSGSGSAGANGCSGNGVPSQSGKTAQVSAVPRTKVKVSGGTQTCSSDLQPYKGGQQQQQQQQPQQQFKSFSLTGNAANQLSQSVRERLMLGSQSLPKGACQEYSLVIRQARTKVSDGSLSDTQAIDVSSPYAPWLRHSNTYSVAPRLSETDSMESLTSLPGHRGSLTHNRLLRDSPNRLSRSNSIRSTKSEKLYPSMLQRSAEQEQEPYYCLPVGAILNHWSQPTSPAPGINRNFPLSPTHSIPRHNVPKNDEIHGSSVSLVSTASSLYSSAEEKQAHEIRKLRRELMDAHEKVQTLTSQLNTNAHVVSAFEQSLSSMNQRLQHLTATSEKKDTELSELRTALETLRTQSIQAGISNGLARQPSSDSVSSLSSACSLDKHEKKKKKGWLRSSFTKAFSRNAKVTKVPHQSEHETERDQSRQSNPPSPPPPPPIDSGQEVQELQKQLREKDLVLTDIRLEALSSAHQLDTLKDTVMKMRSEMLSLKQNNERLQRMVNGGQAESTHLPGNFHYHNNSNSIEPLADLLQSTDDGTADSITLPEGEIADGKRITISVYLGQPHTFRQYYATHYRDVDHEQQESEMAEQSQNRLKNGTPENALNEISIAFTSVSATTTWPQLDNAVRRAFKTHVARLDPGAGLGLGSDSVACYTLGDAQRASDSAPPDLLPYGYVVGHVCTLQVVLQPVAALAFETLIPKGVAQRLVSLLAEHRRIVLCGAPGTGKTHLAAKLAQFHAQSVEREDKEAVVTFNVDNKTAKELRQYLAHLSEQAAAGETASIPSVVILDNLHKAGPLSDALGSLPRNLPCLLGTMAQSACSATSLQLQHGFRWVLVAPHMEPARGLLGRVLRRRLATLELENGPQPELAAVLGWLPRIWQHLNAFLETHSSGDVVIGPRLFLSCPLELDAARAWFADIWNYSLTPYLRDAAREGLQLYGRRAAWTDPCQFIIDTYPWSGAAPQGLTNITAKDVGLESDPSSQTESDGDPLLNMLMRLQEAANYSSPHSNDSDCNSLDSNVTNNSNNTVGTESVS